MKNSVPYWTDECSLAIKERKRARKKVQKTKLPQDYLVYKHKKAVAQKIIKSSKKVAYWHTYCNSLNKNSNFYKIWKTVKRMNNIDNTSNVIPILRVGNKEYITDKHKVEAVSNSFKLTSSDVNYEKLFLAKRKSFLLDNKS